MSWKELNGQLTEFPEPRIGYGWLDDLPEDAKKRLEEVLQARAERGYTAWRAPRRTKEVTSGGSTERAAETEAASAA